MKTNVNMELGDVSIRKTAKGWLPSDPVVIENWIQKLRAHAKAHPLPLVKPIKDLRKMVYTDPELYASFQGMFAEAHRLKKRTPLKWQPEPINFEEFLVLLNAIMTTAPEAYQTGSDDSQQPAGMIGFPINALLVWPMATNYGYNVFSNALVNQQLKKILNYWAESFLVKKASRYVLEQNDPSQNVIAWLSPKAQNEMITVAASALGQGKNPVTAITPFDEVFKCKPNKPYFGFKSWDDFFTREFCKKARPVSEPDNDDVIVNACESAPLTHKKNVKLSENFWLKGQKYSLENMLNWDELTPKFEGGTVYQAFLSALSYHRWHSPVNGTVVKAYVVNGSYYLENLSEGFYNKKHDPDAVAPNSSQQFLTAVATRALIFIQADNDEIGLMCVMPVGMAEVSSCEITVKPGQRVKKGEQIGMFHFGGSTHCLIFGPQVKLKFENYGQKPNLNATNVRVNTKIAEVKR